MRPHRPKIQTAAAGRGTDNESARHRLQNGKPPRPACRQRSQRAAQPTRGRRQHLQDAVSRTPRDHATGAGLMTTKTRGSGNRHRNRNHRPKGIGTWLPGASIARTVIVEPTRIVFTASHGRRGPIPGAERERSILVPQTPEVPRQLLPVPRSQRKRSTFGATDTWTKLTPKPTRARILNRSSIPQIQPHSASQSIHSLTQLIHSA